MTDERRQRAVRVPLEPSGCVHSQIVTMTGENYGVPVGVYLWACADCRVRFYPACPVCVDVGHRNGHPAVTQPDAVEEPERER